MATKFIKVSTFAFNINQINTSSKAFFHFGTILNAGSKLRLARGQQRCGNEEGPLHDLPDWTTPDGSKSAPPTTGQIYAQRKKQAVQARTERLWKEMEEDVRNGNWKQFY